MTANTIKETIIQVLEKDDRLSNEAKNELNQTLLLDLVNKIDETIIGLLLEEESLREKFFVKIKDVYVFKMNDFRFFMEENRIDNSYTQYKNRIGLTDGKKFLADSGDMVLDFPYKDCVLAGGQSTEEGEDAYFEYEEEKTRTVKGEKVVEPAGYKEKTTKRKEIFFNQILAKDEIDRLFDPKALVNWKRYTKDGEEEVREIHRDENGIIKENLIIKGNNLLALHSLKKQFAGKVKLIYIDPPYNKGNDGFVYNDSFTHSSWLTFVMNRIQTAKDLLRSDGVLAVSIDLTEAFHFKVLLDEIFGRNNFLSSVSVQNNPKGRVMDKNFSTSHEYLLFYSKSALSEELSIKKTAEEISKDYLLSDENGSYRLLELRNTHREFGKHNRRNLYFPLYVDLNSGSVSLEKTADNNMEVLPLWDDNFEGCWTWGETKVKLQDHLLIGREVKDRWKIYRKSYATDSSGENVSKQLKTIWLHKDFHTDKGQKTLDKILGKRLFKAPKPVGYIKTIIDLVTSTQENDLILDFFAGSGTTGHATLELNQEDDGNRRFILVEQMDYIESITAKRMQKVVEKESTFVYLELAQWNEKAKAKILACESLDELEKLFDSLYEIYFLNYNLKVKEFKEKVIQEDNFKTLSLDEQKKMFLAMLDLNQLYVQETEMADKRFGISKEDQALTKQFYYGE
jgi:adenine-specific DNA-methyltransferase